MREVFQWLYTMMWHFDNVGDHVERILNRFSVVFRPFET